jgi:hypothetical protein
MFSPFFQHYCMLVGLMVLFGMYWYIVISDVPGQVPGRPYASDINLRSLILSWGCPPTDGGSPVSGYRVEMCEAEKEVWQTLTDQCHVSSL